MSFFKKNSSPEQFTPCHLKEATLPIEKAFILICEKCGKKKQSHPESLETDSTRLQKALRERIKDDFGKGKIKPLLASCMSLCPEKEITIGIIPLHQKDSLPQFFSLEGGDTPAQVELVLAKTLSSLSKAEP